MKDPIEVTCIVCQLRFCCADCRWKHEQRAHELTYDCPLCRGNPFLCHPQHLNQDFIEHLTSHLPLRCRKCQQTYTTMQDFQDLDKCTTISELCSFKRDDVEEKFDSIYEKIRSDTDNFEAIVSVNKSSKTAVITPILRKNHIVEYDSSEDDSIEGNKTPHPNLAPKTPKVDKQNTPHIKKMRQTPHVKKWMLRQAAFDEDEETLNDASVNMNPKTPTPSRNDELEVPEASQQVTTPTSHLPHVLKLAQIVTTSTPTNPATEGWLRFPDTANDSPLSEIETADSPSQKPTEMPKLKGIIVDSRRGSQESTEKQVTFQDSNDSSAKKKVTFADGTVFNQDAPNIKRVYRKPKRMLTPGPQKPKRAITNPRFQALLNRFENRVAMITQTPLNRLEKSQETPQVEHNVLARAISFKESPGLENTKDTDLFSSCVDPEPNNAITMLTANIAGSLQKCLASLIRTQEDETEIEFKFTVTKKKVSVQRMANDGSENFNEIDRDAIVEKENIWSTVTKVVKKVFWGDKETSHRSFCHDSTSSSTSKRKYEDISDDSPLNHKRRKFEGRLRGRPPIRPNLDMVGLRTHSAENSSLLKQFSYPEESLNQSF
ncbi:unnamed protein product [Pieris brassicae]|uniref:Uncharacterized protein n=1 Tax=Pieris brassicae TaxID=7116 RepID=A0A9P0TFZ6_PIEBR|nr:unnamed protein product [Pieris brassicae]